jgi:hypothetical protein
MFYILRASGQMLRWYIIALALWVMVWVEFFGTLWSGLAAEPHLESVL